MYHILIILGLAWSVVSLPLGENQIDTNRTESYGEEGPYFEGDIILSEEQRQGLLGKQGIKMGATELQNIAAGIKMITSTTCVKIIPRTIQKDYVKLNNYGGCASPFGYRGGIQGMSLQYCPPGSIAHEFLHLAGIAHEHNRSDRDDYVAINFANIIPDKEYNFHKVDSTYWDNYGTTYDYGSIMHYDETSFSKNGQKTVVPKQMGVTIGQRNGLSQKDIQLVKTMYKC